MAKFSIVLGDDWSGLYVDGKVVIQGHSLRDYELLEAARDHGPVEGIEIVEANITWLEDEGYLPNALADVVTA